MANRKNAGEFNIPLSICFVDFRKGFNSIKRVISGGTADNTLADDNTFLAEGNYEIKVLQII